MRYRISAALAWLNTYTVWQSEIPSDFLTMGWAVPFFPFTITVGCILWPFFTWMQADDAARRAQVLAEWGKIDQHRPTTPPKFAFDKNW